MPLMDSVVLMGDPAAARVPVEECDEPLVNAGRMSTWADRCQGIRSHAPTLGVPYWSSANRSHGPGTVVPRSAGIVTS